MRRAGAMPSPLVINPEGVGRSAGYPDLEAPFARLWTALLVEGAGFGAAAVEVE